jgi:hypothetical protein
MSGLYAREAHKTKVLLEERSRWRAALERIRDARGACDWPSKSPLEWCADQAIEALTGTVVEERGPTIEAAEQFLDDVGSRIVEECQTEGCLLDPGHEGEHRVVEKR